MTGTETLVFYALNFVCWIIIPVLFIQIGEVLEIQ